MPLAKLLSEEVPRLLALWQLSLQDWASGDSCSDLRVPTCMAFIAVCLPRNSPRRLCSLPPTYPTRFSKTLCDWSPTTRRPTRDKLLGPASQVLGRKDSAPVKHPGYILGGLPIAPRRRLKEPKEQVCCQGWRGQCRAGTAGMNQTFVCPGSPELGFWGNQEAWPFIIMS